MTDNSKHIWMDGKSYFQLGFENVAQKANTMYGIQADKNASNIVKLVEVDIAGSVPIATTETAGIVKPDGTTVEVQEDGTISIPDAVAPLLDDEGTKGLVKPDGNTLIIDDGVLKVSDTYDAGLADKGSIVMLLGILQQNNTITQNDYDNIYNSLYPSSQQSNTETEGGN